MSARASSSLLVDLVLTRYGRRRNGLRAPSVGHTHPGSDVRFDRVGSVDKVFVLPDPDDVPAGFRQSAVGIAIASLRRADLLLPPLDVRPWPDNVLGTAVPEAPVDVNRHSSTRKDDVGAPAQAWQDEPIDTEAEASSVKNPP